MGTNPARRQRPRPVSYRTPRPRTTRDPATLTDQALAHRAVRVSGLSDGKFAKQVLAGLHSERSLRRWLAGESQMRPAARAQLLAYVRKHEPQLMKD